MKWRARISSSLIIIAVCARPFVAAAARAGYRVAAFDAFCDGETRQLAAHSARLAYAGGGFVADEVLAALDALDMPEAVIVYGSGLEHNPGLLQAISKRYRLAGNAPEAVSLVKSPERFFLLLDRLEIAYPETRLHMPDQREGWLSKRAGGSGGTHVRYFDGEPADYYQREVQGKPVSVLFLADGANAVVAGFNEQWTAPLPHMPFRYGGMVGNADLPPPARAAMTRAVEKVTAAAGLRGLNSMDFMLDGEMPLALEINPRLSASFGLYDGPDLLECHLRACGGELSPPRGACSVTRAQQVMYAPGELVIGGAMRWPSWVADIPAPGTRILPGEPVCTVLAQAGSAEAAKALVFARAHQVEAQLQPHFLLQKNYA